MDSFEWNKIFGAVLGTVLVVVALNLLVGGLMEPEKAAKPGMEVAVSEEHNTGPTAPVEEPKPDWGTVIPVADLAAGEKTHARCQQCHDFSKGGPNKIGPNLYGIVGNIHAHAPDFPYSAGVIALKGQVWGYDELDTFIKNPKAAIAGTKMSFAGLSKQQDRINLIAYLRTVSDSPLAIPAPNPAAAAPAAPPAEGAAEAPAGQLQTTPSGQPGAETAPAVPGATPAAPGATPAAAPAAGTPAPAAPATPAPVAPKPAGGH
jgi:cytochrome c